MYLVAVCDSEDDITQEQSQLVLHVHSLETLNGSVKKNTNEIL